MIILQKKTKEYNLNWPETSEYPYRILIVGGFGSRKTNAFPNLINNEPDIDNIYLYEKDSCEVKYQLLLINKGEKQA